MQIRILGTGSGLPELGKHLSSVHVNCRGKQYLLDCGEGSIYQLLRYGVDVNDLDAVVITHFHPDHVAGVFMLVQMLYLQGRSKDLSIFIPERTEEFEGLFSMFYTFPERLCFRLTILPMAELNSKFPDLQAWPNDHLLGYS
ncbi:MAG TPA: MBL fold metallo-hydrolase, partial [Candidatus Cloacimonadota bacterium]|nr:MBL fold metallo-hydrolase [Candidatus Cloacimonadota bacterium]